MKNVKKVGVLSFMILLLSVFSAGLVFGQQACNDHTKVLTVLAEYTSGGTSQTSVKTTTTTMNIDPGSCLGETLTITDAQFIGAPTGFANSSFTITAKNINGVATTTTTTSASITFDLVTDYTAGTSDPTGSFAAAYAIIISYKGADEGVTFDCGGYGGPSGDGVCGGNWTNGTAITAANVIAALGATTPEVPPEEPPVEPPVEPPIEEKECKDDPTACENQRDCEREDWYWYDDKCNEEEEPECSVEKIERCTTQSKCENAGGLYWDTSSAKCKVCLADCVAGESTSDSLKAKCCVNKCSPSPAKNLTSGSLPKCVIESNMSVYYEYSCNGVSGNGIKKANGYCDGNATLNITSSGVRATKILYGKEYDITIYFNKDVKKSPNPALNLRYNDTIVENMILTNCTKDKLINGYSQVFCSKITVSEKGLNGNINIELDAKTLTDGVFKINQDTILIDTINLQKPTVKISRLS